MRSIKSSGTKDEMRLSKTLWHLGYRYRKNDKSVFGKPDLVFRKYKIAVFVDSEFFHGKDWETEKFKIKSNQEFWHKKIGRNIERDKEVNEYLISNGWTVLRFWSKEVRNDLEKCVEQIILNISEKRKHYR